MKILIIGGTGNISTAITRALVERGDDVTLYNRGKSKVQIPDGYKTILGDRTDYAVFEAQMAEAGRFDCVIDMICYKPEEAESIVRAFRGRIGQLIFCSTVDVYTKPAKLYPITAEAERQPSPVFPYAFNKGLCENILREAHQRGDFPLTIIRPAQTYNDSSTPIPLLGPGTSLLNRIRKGKPVIVHGNGTSLWVASHRDDVGPAFVGAIGNSETFGKGYDVTGDEWMTWEAYYETAARVMDAPPITFVHIPTDLLGKIAPKSAEWCVVNFHYNNIFDNTPAKTDLGFQYTITWEEGVRRMVAWHDERGAIDGSPEYPFYDQIVAAWQRLGEAIVKELAGLDV
jgi:nucleoside-diphosphate-sugar epimerase